MIRLFTMAVLQILLLSIFFNRGYSQVNGINTIDPAGTNFTSDPGGVSGKNYTSFNKAVIALKSYGISGAVTFNVASGTYNEQVRIGLITGVSASKDITFQSASLDSSSVIITYSASSNNDNYVVKLIGARYINFKAMAIRATGANYGYAVVIDSNTESSSFVNNFIQSNLATSTNVVPIWSGPSNNQYITLKDNLVTGGNYGIYMYGSDVTPYSAHNLIEGNIIRDYYYIGLIAYYQDGIKIRNNSIQNLSPTGNAYGIYASYCFNELEISGNNLNLNGSSTIYGIYAFNNPGTALLKGKIFNNFIAAGGGINGTHYGISIGNCAYQEISFNSINMYVSSTSSRCIYIPNGNFITLKNNIFAATGGGMAIYVVTTTAITASDYNDLYTSGSVIGYWSTNVANLATWKTASGKDASSVSVNPGFNSQTDLHVNTSGISNLGASVTGINNDIDGDIRLFPPDIGADEFTLRANDAGVTSLLSPLPPCPGSNAVSIKVKNYGTSVLNSVTVSWWVNGVLQGTAGYSFASVPQYAETGINLGNYVFSTGTIYNLKFKISLPNGVADLNPKNDSLVYNNLKIGLSGIFTIGSTSSDYASFTDAVNDLIQSGLCGSVVFRVKAGKYNERINIPKILGSAATKTITFESFDLDSNSVDLYYSSTSTYDNYTVKLSGANYLTFRHLKIRATGSDYGYAFVLTGGSSYNSVLNCIISSYMGATSTNLGGIYDEPNSLENYNTIKNNFIQGGYFGVSMNGNNTARENFNIIHNNIIRDFAYYGITLSHQNYPIITENLIQNYNGSTISYGIYIYFNYDSLKMTRNKILLNAYSGNYGIYINTSTSTLTTQTLIANNFISITGNSMNYNHGIYLTNTSNINVLFNSVNVATPATVNGRAFYLNSGSNVATKNNIFANFGGGYSIYVANINALTSSDYNDLYTNGTVLGYWTNNRANLAAWKTASGMDNFSVSVDPFFVSPVDLHSYSRFLESAGQFSLLVKDDIDNEIRNTTKPDIGADEFSVFQRDASIVSLISPVVPCPGVPGIIVIKLRNCGIDTIKTSWIKWTVNGAPLPAFNYPGKLASTKETNITIGTFTFNSGTTYNLKVWIDSINGYPDQNHKNDTLFQKTIKTALTGTYTIGSIGKDFPSFTAAIDDLKSFGVCDSVFFVVDTGTYNEQISIPPILGASKYHTITFQSASNDSNSAVISYAAQSISDNYVVQLDGANYVRFKRIKMKSTATGNYGYVLVLKNNASNNIFKNNVIQSVPVNNSNSACVYVQNGTLNNYNQFDNNRMFYGFYGICIYGTSNSLLAKNNVIRNNIISDFYYYGIMSNYQDSIEISKNTIMNGSGSSNNFGIYCNYNFNNSRIIANNISLNVAGQTIGLYLDHCTGTISSKLLVANNMVNIHGTSTNSVYGILCSYGYYINIYHNTFNITTWNPSSSCMNFSSPSTGAYGNISVMNNIMTNTGGGYALNINASAVTLKYVSICNYNDLYVNGTYIGRYGTNDLSGLSSWQTTSGKDANSISVLPDYISATNLHLNNYDPLRVYNPLVEANTDIDGEKRSLVKTVIGADENPSFPVNAGIKGIVSPGKANCEGILPITATLFNYGTTRLDSVYIDYYMNGVKKKSILFKTSLLYLASTNVQIGYDTFLTSNHDIIKINTRLPNGLNDPYPFDDGDSLMHVNIFPIPVITSASSDTACPGTLRVSSNNSHIFFWYDSITGNLVSEDSIFITGNKSAPKTYLVQAGTPGNPIALTTTKTITNSEMGNMFDIKATGSDIVIDSFAIHSNASEGTFVPMALYYRKGTYKGYETDSLSWTFVGIDTVYSNGPGKFTDVSPGHIRVKKGDSIGVYISSTDPFFLLNYADGANVYKDTNIKVTTGNVMFYRFDSFFQSNKTWDGSVYYSTGSLCKSPVVSVKAYVSPFPVVTLINDTSLCKGNAIFLDAGFGIDYTYAWKFGTIKDIISRNQVFYADTSGKYMVTVGNHCGNFAYDSVNILILPELLIDLGHDTILYDNQKITLDAGAGFDSYLWSTGSSSRTITIDSTGIGLHSKSFSVYVTKDGCIGSDTIVITFIKHVGIKPQSDVMIRIYPNPSGDELNVEISGIYRNTVMVLADIQGKELRNVLAFLVNGKVKEKIDISGLPAGVYFLKVSNEKMMKIEKVMKK